jgi:hypothetical protein
MKKHIHDIFLVASHIQMNAPSRLIDPNTKVTKPNSRDAILLWRKLILCAVRDRNKFDDTTIHFDNWSILIFMHAFALYALLHLTYQSLMHVHAVATRKLVCFFFTALTELHSRLCTLLKY